MAKGMGIFAVINKILTAREIRKDPDLRRKTVRFGVHSIFDSVFAVAVSLLLLTFPFFFGGEGSLLFIFGIAVVAVGGMGALVFLGYALLDWILQVSLNRRAITWIALLFFIAAIAGVIFVAVTALSGASF